MSDIILPPAAPKSATVHTFMQYTDDAGRTIIVSTLTHMRADDGTLAPVLLGHSTFKGSGVLMLDMGNGQQHPHQFQFPIPGATVPEAFDAYDAAMGPGTQAEVDRLQSEGRRQSLRNVNGGGAHGRRL